MRADREGSASADSALRSGYRTPGKHRRAAVVAVVVAAAAVALAAFDGTGSSHAASLAKRGRSTRTDGTRARSATAQQTDATTRLLDEWTACERSNGDPNQADPTVEHAVIYIAVRMGALAGGDPTTGACSQYLNAARRAVADGQPIGGWGDDAKYVAYANCMRANGYPTFPYPSGVEPDGHLRSNFNGTGIDPNSPAFLNGNANQTCGKQVGAPAWWINNWGPPGSVDAYPAGTNPNDPLPPGPPMPGGLKPTPMPGIAGISPGNAHLPLVRGFSPRPVHRSPRLDAA
jgi:hypothetical protein